MRRCQKLFHQVIHIAEIIGEEPWGVFFCRIKKLCRGNVPETEMIFADQDRGTSGRGRGYQTIKDNGKIEISEVGQISKQMPVPFIVDEFVGNMWPDVCVIGDKRSVNFSPGFVGLIGMENRIKNRRKFHAVLIGFIEIV